MATASLIFLRVPRPALHPYAYRQVDMATVPAGVGVALTGVWKNFLHGLRFVFATRLLLGTVIMLAVANAGAAAVNAVSSGFFLSNLHGGDLRLLGSLSAALAAGGIVGAIAAGSLAKFVPLKTLTVVSAFNPELHPGTLFPNPALLFQDILVLGGIVTLAGSITGFLLLRRTKEEVINVEQSVRISTAAVVSETESLGSVQIAGEGGNLGSEEFHS
ncbi:MAG: hypothetical protein IMW89_19470 [Ktedonobacteraceae bacterium]|nr:hypothetical protein [Ktedonobacteraceae bacterium]